MGATAAWATASRFAYRPVASLEKRMRFLAPLPAAPIGGSALTSNAPVALNMLASWSKRSQARGERLRELTRPESGSGTRPKALRPTRAPDAMKPKLPTSFARSTQAGGG